MLHVQIFWNILEYSGIFWDIPTRKERTNLACYVETLLNVIFCFHLRDHVHEQTGRDSQARGQPHCQEGRQVGGPEVYRAPSPDLPDQVRHPPVVSGHRLEPTDHLVLQGVVSEVLFPALLTGQV